jgi:beta-lactamase class A
LAADFAQLPTRLRAKTGVVLRPVGAGSKGLVTLGDWSSGPAWSTIKVPLVIAAMRQQNTGQVTAPMTAAITESDNTAAESIWEGLGDPPTAAVEVEAVLREAGDPTTVESRKVRPEYTAFGQTDWSLVGAGSNE